MGLRYRKSINLGCGFRVNFSKSGIGYSWGTKGYRITKKANGGIRKTYSIPGTGLSWTEDSKGRNKARQNRNSRNYSNYNTNPTYVENPQTVLYQAKDADTKALVTDSSKEFMDEIKKFTRIHGCLKWGSIISGILMLGTPPLAILFVIFLIVLIVHSYTRKINLEYDCDDYGKHRMEMLDQAMSRLMDNKMAWQIVTEVANSSLKMHAGASSSVRRKAVRFQRKKPYFLNTDATCYTINLMNDVVYILPDRLIVKGKKGWGVVEHSELNIDCRKQRFIESEVVPRDAEIIGYTWQYVNKNGGPDKRFKNNRQLPECNYGHLGFRSNTGLNVIIYISNIKNAFYFQNSVSKMLEEAEKIRKEASKARV